MPGHVCIRVGRPDRPIRSRRSVRNPQRPASRGDRSMRWACRRARRRLQRRACEGQTGRAGRRDRATDCAVARRFPHHRSDIGVPDTLPCASPARGDPVGRRRDTAGPGRVPKGPIPAEQSGAVEEVPQVPTLPCLRSARGWSQGFGPIVAIDESLASEPSDSLFDGVIPRSTVGRCRLRSRETGRSSGDRPSCAGAGRSFVGRIGGMCSLLRSR